MSQQTDRLSAALAGRYRAERHFGAGGMAIVCLADGLKHDRSQHPDGKRIVVAANDVRFPAPQPSAAAPAFQASRYVIGQNWFTDLKRLTSRSKQ